MGKRPHAALLAAGAMLLAAAPAHATTYDIAFPTGSGPATYAYSPPDVTVTTADTVTFNGPFQYHPLVWNDADFDTQRTGATKSFGFTKAGTYRFHCEVHASMTGSVHIAGNQFATPDFAFSPSSPRANDVVTFTAASAPDPDGQIVRYEWDLDGNGSFESATTTTQVTKAYSSAGVVNVKVRYVDDGHEPSPARAHDVTVAASPGGGDGNPPGGSGSGSGSGGGGTGSGAADVTAPTVRPTPATLRFKGRDGVLGLVSDEAGTATVTVRAAGKVLARGQGPLRAGSGRLKLRLTPAGLARLRRSPHRVAAKLTLVLRDAAGNSRTVRRALALRR